MFEPMMERWSKSYQAEVGKELRKYGLRVDDMLDPDWHPVRTCWLSRSSVCDAYQVHGKCFMHHRVASATMSRCPVLQFRTLAQPCA